MPNRSKIQDEQELVKWIEEGRTYRWMKEQYLKKYKLDVSITMFSNFRRRKGLDGRIVRDDNLIPWQVNPEHRFAWAIQMLRAEARRRAGHVDSESVLESLAGFKRTLDREQAVVHYDPNTKQGFFLVRRRDEVDTDLIREPDRKTTQRRTVV